MGSGVRIAIGMGSLLIFIGAIVGGSITAWIYKTENTKSQNYIKTECNVTEERIYEATCEVANCDSVSCTYYDLYCWKVDWTVIYDVNGFEMTSVYEDPNSYFSYSKAQEQMNKYPAGNVYPCYYDKNEVSKIQWKSPNPTPYLIAFAICFPLAVLFFILFVKLLFFYK